MGRFVTINSISLIDIGRLFRIFKLILQSNALPPELYPLKLILNELCFGLFQVICPLIQVVEYFLKASFILEREREKT